MRKNVRKKLIGLVALSLVSSSAIFAADMPGKGITVRPIEANLLEEQFQHQILYKALEALGYTIATPEEANYQTIHLALGLGDADYTTVHWDPLHTGFFEESGGSEKLARVGDYIPGALQGYLVDTASYEAGVRNIGDLKDPEIAKRFDADGDGKADLAGCPPGWGCEIVIEHHLDEYGLRDTVTHNQGQYNAVIADTIARHEAGKPVIYYTWTPYWVSSVLIPNKNVQWIEVPYSSLPDNRKDDTTFKGKNLGFAVNSQKVVASNKFLAANPAAAKLFELATIDINDVSAQNGRLRNGADSPEDIENDVNNWIKANQKTFDSWLKAARGAS